MLKRFATLLMLLTALFLFNACDDAEMIVDSIIEVPSVMMESSYTGRLHRVGTVEKFGVGVDSVQAIEWNGKSLYMLAVRGLGLNRGQYLFIVDRNTGVAEFVNPGAMNLGGDFRQGRGFTQVLYVQPWDMAWITPSEDSVEGIDYPVGYIGEMLAICPVIDSIVTIDIQTGFAGRINWEKGYCVLNAAQDTVLEPRIIDARAMTHDGMDLFMAGVTDASKDFHNRVQFFRVSGNFRCATPLSDNPLPLSGGGELYSYALCFDDQNMYMADAYAKGLYMIDRETGEAIFVAEWSFVEMSEGYERHPLGDILNVKENARGSIDITGLAFDGQTMFAVDSFTDALYKLEKR